MIEVGRSWWVLQKKGIAHKLFTERKYYNFPTSNGQPYLEKKFSEYEGLYGKIIAQIENKRPLDYPIKQSMVDWMLMMKTRNPYFRDKNSEMITWAEKTKFGLTHGREEMIKKEKEFEKMGQDGGRLIQLARFANPDDYEELRVKYSTNFLNRDWKLFISDGQNFITSNNPGYSFTFSEHYERLGIPPLSRNFNLETNVNSVHCFPMAKNLCVCLFPIPWESVDEDKMRKAFSKEIEVIRARPQDIDEINMKTLEAADKYLVGNDPVDFNKYANAIQERQRPYQPNV